MEISKLINTSLSISHHLLPRGFMLEKELDNLVSFIPRCYLYPVLHILTTFCDFKKTSSDRLGIIFIIPTTKFSWGGTFADVS